MKTKRFFLFFAAFFAFFVLSSCGKEPPRDVTVRFTASPSYYGEVRGNTEQILKGGAASEWVTAVPNDGFVFREWSDGVTEARRADEHFDADTELVAYFEPEACELPIFAFNMPSGDEVTSKTEYTPVTLHITNTDEKYCLKNAGGLLRGRGNATWKLMEKKSYKLKLDEKENLLGAGCGKAKQWVLLANHCDQTMLRNYLAFYLGSHMEGLEYTTSANFVEVYINGDYKGVYLLCEQTQIHKNRVNIEEDPERTDTGYLIELDQYADDDEGNKEGETYFTAGGELYSFKQKVTPEQCEFIKNYVTETDKAIMGGKRGEVEKYIDLASCVDMYLVQEYMMNIDVGWSSFFMYKKAGDKLFFGPVWDFDLAAGNDGRLENGGYEGIYVGEDYGFTQSSRWYIALMKQSWFRELVKNRWEEKKDLFEGTSAEARRTADSMKNAVKRNYERWNVFGKKINQEPSGVVVLPSYDAHLNHLCSWLDGRFEWLDAYFKNN